MRRGDVDAMESVTICALTTDPTEAPLFRLPVEPSARDGLRETCRLMVDKITTVPKAKIGGRLDAADILRLNQASSSSSAWPYRRGPSGRRNTKL